MAGCAHSQDVLADVVIPVVTRFRVVAPQSVQGIEEAAKVGAVAVIQPGGSVRDAEVIAAANRLRVAMVFTGMRHFRHG